MSISPFAPHQATAAEQVERLAHARRGLPFLVFRDGTGRQRIVVLSEELTSVAVGRSPDSDVCLSWDPEVSRLHAELRRVGGQWLIVDDGLSRNGTRVGDSRVQGRQRLVDGDVVVVGETALGFCQPTAGGALTTSLSSRHASAAQVTDAQRRVLIALCRPFKSGASDVVPATNPQIAAELHLTVAAVKTHLRALFHAFEIEDLPQHEKRRRLVGLAFASGLVRDRDL